MHELLLKLAGDDRRSLGRTAEVVADVLRDPALFGVLMQGLLTDDPVIRMRAADAAEKISERHPEYLQPYKKMLLSQVVEIEQQEVRWHTAQMLPRLHLSLDEISQIVAILFEWTQRDSRLVKTFSMQALADLAEKVPSLRSQVIPLLHDLTETGSPAMRSRGRKLLERMWRTEQERH